MADPLPRNEDGQFHMELELHHFERCGVEVAHQVTNQSAVFVDLLRPRTIGHACRLHDGGIVAHHVDQANETFVQTGKLLPNERLYLFCHATKIGGLCYQPDCVGRNGMSV